MSFPYEFITEENLLENPIEKHNRAFFINEQDLKLIQSTTSSINFPFGTFENDIIEFSVFNIENTLLLWERIDEPKEFEQISSKFKNADAENDFFGISVFKGKYLVLRGEKQLETQTLPNELLLSPFDDLKRNEFGDGTYKVAYSLFNDVVGSDIGDNQLIITEISPSRTEIKCIPKFLKNDERGSQINKDFKNFSIGTITTKNVIPFVENQLDEANFQKILDSQRAEDSDFSLEIDRIRLKFSFKEDVDLVRDLDIFFREISEGTLNTLFTLFEDSIEIDRINVEYNKWINYVLSTSARFVGTPEDQEELKKDISTYTRLLNGALDTSIIPNFNNKEQNFLKNLMNFGDNVLFPILTWFSSIENKSDPVQHRPLVFKLKDPLPTNFAVKNEFWISNNSISDIILQDINFDAQEEVAMMQIRGPNFDLFVGENRTPTKESTFDDLINSGSEVSSELIKLFNKEFKEENVNVDYTDFSNFVHFSSARQRIDNFILKMSCISDLNNQIQTLQSESIAITNPTIKAAFINSEIVPLEEKKQDVITNFTGYETFLFTSDDPKSFPKFESNPIEFDEKIGNFKTLENLFFLEPFPVPQQIDTVDPQVQAWYAENAEIATMYDKINDNWLVNNVPEWLRKNSDNEQYLRFLNMIGEHFDIIWQMITSMNAVRKPENRLNGGISQELVSTMLQSMGFCSFNGTAEQDLSLTLLGTSPDGTSVEEIPGRERTQIIWRRLLNNLPYIYKTKGTEECIRAVLATYGIPDHLIFVKEYGGLQLSDNPNTGSQFIFDNVNYELEISESAHFHFGYSGSAPQSIEFKVRFNKDKTDRNDFYWPLIRTDNWVFAAERIKGDWGRFSFKIDPIDPIKDDPVEFFCPAIPKNWQDLDFDVTQSMTTGSIPLGSITGSLENEINAGLVLPIFNGNAFNILIRKDDLSDFYDTGGKGENNANRNYTIFIKAADQGNILFDVKSNQFLGPQHNANFENSPEIFFGNVDSSSFIGTIDQLRIYSSALTEKRFENHVIFSKAYDKDQAAFDKTLNIVDFDPTLDSLLVRVDFDLPVDLANNPTQSNNLVILDDVENIFYENFQSGSFPYTFDRRFEREVVNLPNFGAEVFSNFKIRFKKQSLISNLAPDTRSTLPSAKTDPVDSNRLGVFFTPLNVINSQIIRFLGDINLGDFIGDPADLYRSEYKNFEALRKLFFKFGFGRLDFQAYINLVKAHFDKSLFPTIEKLVPARSRFLRGLLIEQSILERNKIERKPVVREIHNNFSASIEDNVAIDSNLVGIAEEKKFIIAENNEGETTAGRFEDRTETIIDIDQVRNQITPDYFKNFVNSKRLLMFDDEDENAFGTMANHGLYWNGPNLIKVELIPSKLERSVEIIDDHINPNDIDIILSADLSGSITGVIASKINAQFVGSVNGIINGNILINSNFDGKLTGEIGANLNGIINGFIYDGTANFILDGLLNGKSPILPEVVWSVNDNINNFGTRKRPIFTGFRNTDKGVVFEQEEKVFDVINLVCVPSEVDFLFNVSGSFVVTESMNDGIITESGSVEIAFTQSVTSLPFGLTSIEGSYNEDDIPVFSGSIFVEFGPASSNLDFTASFPQTYAEYKFNVPVTEKLPFGHYLVNHVGTKNVPLLNGYTPDRHQVFLRKLPFNSKQTFTTTINDESKLEEGKLPVERTRNIFERDRFSNGSEDFHWFSNETAIGQTPYFYVWPAKFIQEVDSNIITAAFTGSNFPGPVSEL